MAGIFSLFHDPTQNVKAPTVFGSAGLNKNYASKLKEIGAPGATPGKIFGQKSKGLSIRSSSELNIHSSALRAFEAKKSTVQPEKVTLKPFDILGKSKSPNKQKSPIRLKSPQKQLKSLSPKLVVSTNEDVQNKEKNQEFVFKKPSTPRKSQKLNMDYPEPEILAPIGDIEFDTYETAYYNYLKSSKGFFCTDDDEGFLSDSEPVPFNLEEEEVHSHESSYEDVEVPPPDLEPLPDLDSSFHE